MTPPVALREIFAAFRHGWKTLLGVYLVFTVVTATMVSPLVAGLMQAMVSMSGESALSDADIASYFFSPGGVMAGLAIGTVGLTLQVLGYATLLIPARSLLRDGRATALAVPPVVTFALPRLLRISLRLILWLLVWSLPFAGGLGAVYFFLLREHDINYYLAAKPPAFRWAAALAVLILAGHLVAMARLVTGWVHALPLVVFRGAAPGPALRLSQRASRGERTRIFAGLVAWGVVTPLVGSLVNLPWSTLALWAAQQFHDQPGGLVLVLGVCLAVAVAIGWFVGFVGLSLLALQNMRLYLQAGLDTEARPHRASARELPVDLKTALAIGLVACAITTFLCYRWIDGLDAEHPAVVIAHRGASIKAPENTLAAVRAAVDAKADWVEIDVQENADGSVVVFHDRDFKRMGGPGRPIWELSDADIAAIDIGSWKSPDFAAERAPLLSEVLSTCKDRSGVLIELKYYGRDQRLEERVIEVVEAAGMADQVMVMSLNHAGIRKIRQLRPQWRIGLLSTVALGNVTRLDVDFLGLNARTTSRRLIEEADRRGIKVYVWTVNDPIDMAAQLGRGVDGLITDDPALAGEVLAERADASFPEKLLFNLAAFLGKPPPDTAQ